MPYWIVTSVFHSAKPEHSGIDPVVGLYSSKAKAIRDAEACFRNMELIDDDDAVENYRTMTDTGTIQYIYDEDELDYYYICSVTQAEVED